MRRRNKPMVAAKLQLGLRAKGAAAAAITLLRTDGKLLIW
jgi:hypothetical protein